MAATKRAVDSINESISTIVRRGAATIIKKTVQNNRAAERKLRLQKISLFCLMGRLVHHDRQSSV
jgi:hypothetical protein